MKSSLVEILTTALTETAGLLAGAFKKFFNVSSPTGTVNSFPDVVPGNTGGLFTVNSVMNANTINFVDESTLDSKLTTLAALAATSLPNTTAGAAGGLFIAGANATTSIATALTANITGNLSGSVGSLATQAKADVNAEVVDVLGTDTIPDSVPVDGAQPTIAQALYMITQRLYEAAVTGTTLTVYKPDGTTALVTCTINDASTPTSITRAT
jgi:hypothetical protein